jgi:peptidoglycan biosynthesis protein MviN/MurJ (putative lipid II flippase)
VKPRWAIPLNAALISLAINCLLPLINIGSTAALNAFFSPSGVSILSSYILCIGVLLLKRLRCEALPSRRWTLGKFGMAINIAALCFLVPLCIFMFFPSTVLVTTLNMNWGCLMYGAVVLFATAYYVVYGRERYTSPVHRVRRDP